jgi:hypothetical protein
MARTRITKGANMIFTPLWNNFRQRVSEARGTLDGVSPQAVSTRHCLHLYGIWPNSCIAITCDSSASRPPSSSTSLSPPGPPAAKRSRTRIWTSRHKSLQGSSVIHANDGALLHCCRSPLCDGRTVGAEAVGLKHSEGGSMKSDELETQFHGFGRDCNGVWARDGWWR